MNHDCESDALSAKGLIMSVHPNLVVLTYSVYEQTPCSVQRKSVRGNNRRRQIRHYRTGSLTSRRGRCAMDLMQSFQAALEENPAADLMSMSPDSYRFENQNAQYRQLSYAAKINLRTLDELYNNLRDEPEVNLLSIFPKNYTRRITMATGPKVLPGSKKAP